MTTENAIVEKAIVDEERRRRDLLAVKQALKDLGDEEGAPRVLVGQGSEEATYEGR